MSAGTLGDVTFKLTGDSGDMFINTTSGELFGGFKHPGVYAMNVTALDKANKEQLLETRVFNVYGKKPLVPNTGTGAGTDGTAHRHGGGHATAAADTYFRWDELRGYCVPRAWGRAQAQGVPDQGNAGGVVLQGSDVDVDVACPVGEPCQLTVPGNMTAILANLASSKRFRDLFTQGPGGGAGGGAWGSGLQVALVCDWGKCPTGWTYDAVSEAVRVERPGMPGVSGGPVTLLAYLANDQPHRHHGDGDEDEDADGEHAHAHYSHGHHEGSHQDPHHEGWRRAAVAVASWNVTVAGEHGFAVKSRYAAQFAEYAQGTGKTKVSGG